MRIESIDSVINCDVRRKVKEEWTSCDKKHNQKTRRKLDLTSEEEEERKKRKKKKKKKIKSINKCVWE